MRASRRPCTPLEMQIESALRMIPPFDFSSHLCAQKRGHTRILSATMDNLSPKNAPRSCGHVRFILLDQIQKLGFVNLHLAKAVVDQRGAGFVGEARRQKVRLNIQPISKRRHPKGKKNVCLIAFCDDFGTAAQARPFSMQNGSRKRRVFSGEYAVFHCFGIAK